MGVYMRVSARAAAAAAAVVALVGLAATPAAAADTATSGGGAGSLAYCQVNGTIRLDDPGLPHEGQLGFRTLDTNGSTAGQATLHCTGSVRGRRILADEPGGYAEYGWTIGTCAGGHGEGVYEAWIPTVRGVQYVTGAFDLTYDGTPLTQGEPEGTGTEAGQGFRARFWFGPTVGQCSAEQPLLEFSLRQEQVMVT